MRLVMNIVVLQWMYKYIELKHTYFLYQMTPMFARNPNLHLSSLNSTVLLALWKNGRHKHIYTNLHSDVILHTHAQVIQVLLHIHITL